MRNQIIPDWLLSQLRHGIDTDINEAQIPSHPPATLFHQDGSQFLLDGEPTRMPARQSDGSMGAFLTSEKDTTPYRETEHRGLLAPFAKSGYNNSVYPAIPEALGGAGVKTMHDIVSGNPVTREEIDHGALGAANFMLMGGMTMPRPRGSVGMGGRPVQSAPTRDLDSLGYYSAALEAAKAWPQGKGTPEQAWRQIVDAPGVRDNEIIATNFHRKLLGTSGAREFERFVALRSHVDEARQAIEKELGQLKRADGESNANWSARQKARKAEIDARIGQPVADMSDADAAVTAAAKGGNGLASITRDDLVKHLRENRVGLREVQRGDVPDFPGNTLAGETKFSDYSLDPSNPTYRETVLHLPENLMPFDAFLKEYRRNNPRSMLSDVDVRELYDTNEPLVGMHRGGFVGGHFDEPNITGHMMTSLNKHKGKPVFTLDQIQSDWGQRLRDEGVRDEAKIADLKSQLKGIGGPSRDLTDSPQWERAARFLDRIGESGRDIHYSEIGEALDRVAKDKAYNDFSNYPRIRNRASQIERDLASERAMRRRIEGELQTAQASVSGHPLVNTTDQWVNTTLRRGLQQAIDAEADYMAIPSGKTVLSYNPGDDHGMATFYDQIVPKNLGNILSKLDKAGLRRAFADQLETPSGMKGNGFSLFEITPKMREEARKGLPLFANPAQGSMHAFLQQLYGDDQE